MLHWIYPRLCELCHCPSEAELCDECAAKLQRVPMPICLYCGAPVAGELDDPYRCRECRARPRSFDFARSALINTPQALRLVYRLKYHHANYLSYALAGIMHEMWNDTPKLAEHSDWGLVPVPASAEHLYARGYNQAEELARALAKRLGLKLYTPLMRQSAQDDSQTRLSAAARWRNALLSYTVASAYASGRKSLPPRLVLVDDVYTTGSTARACARALKNTPGVKQVGVITLLRAQKG